MYKLTHARGVGQILFQTYILYDLIFIQNPKWSATHVEHIIKSILIKNMH